MPRITVGRFPRIAAVVFAALFGLVIAAGASADTPPGRGPGRGPLPAPTPAGGDCAVLQVQLNGAKPATQTCLAQTLDGQGTGTSGGAAAIASTSCAPNDVQLFHDKNYGGRRICFRGAGTANLENYTWFYWPCVCYVSWNDEMDSFYTGAQYVNFYEHANALGARLRYASYQQRPRLPLEWEFRVSSICIWGPDWSCP
jgi:hypothetical protein